MKKDLMEVINERINATEQQKFTLVPTEFLEKETGLSKRRITYGNRRIVTRQKIVLFY